MMFWLVVWNMVFMTFHVLGMSSSQSTFIFFKVLKPPTSVESIVFFEHPLNFHRITVDVGILKASPQIPNDSTRRSRSMRRLSPPNDQQNQKWEIT